MWNTTKRSKTPYAGFWLLYPQMFLAMTVGGTVTTVVVASEFACITSNEASTPTSVMSPPPTWNGER